MANSYAVAHTPQPHIGEAYVGIKCSISTMYRGAVPITEHQPADVLEPLCGTGWRGAPRPHKGTTLRPLRFNRSSVPLWGWGGMQNRSAVHVISIFVGATAAYRLLSSCQISCSPVKPLPPCRPPPSNLQNLREIVPIRMAIVKNRKKSSSPKHTAGATWGPRPLLSVE